MHINWKNYGPFSQKTETPRPILHPLPSPLALTAHQSRPRREEYPEYRERYTYCSRLWYLRYAFRLRGSQSTFLVPLVPIYSRAQADEAWINITTQVFCCCKHFFQVLYSFLNNLFKYFSWTPNISQDKSKWCKHVKYGDLTKTPDDRSKFYW